MNLDNFITGSSNVFGSLVSFAITLSEFTRILGFDGILAKLYLQHSRYFHSLSCTSLIKRAKVPAQCHKIYKYGNTTLNDYYFALSWPYHISMLLRMQLPRGEIGRALGENRYHKIDNC